MAIEPVKLTKTIEWEEDDISLIPNYDSYFKEEIHCVLKHDGSYWYKIIQGDEVIECKKKYIPKKYHPDQQRTLVTLYITHSNNKKIFCGRFLFYSEKTKAKAINETLRFIKLQARQHALHVIHHGK